MPFPCLTRSRQIWEIIHSLLASMDDSKPPAQMGQISVGNKCILRLRFLVMSRSFCMSHNDKLCLLHNFPLNLFSVLVQSVISHLHNTLAWVRNIAMESIWVSWASYKWSLLELNAMWKHEYSFSLSTCEVALVIKESVAH